MRGSRFHTTVGSAIYHTVGDRAQAVNQLAIDFDHAYADLGSAVGVLPYEGSGERVKKHPDWFVWWNAAASPLFAAWSKFKAEQTSGDTTGPGGSWIAYANRWATDYPVYESWRQRLIDLRASAHRMGIPLSTSEPQALPTTTIEDVEAVAQNVAQKAGSAVDTLGSVLKVALWGGVVLGGAYVAAQIYKDVRR